jgi:hypothetical protein
MATLRITPTTAPVIADGPRLKRAACGVFSSMARQERNRAIWPAAFQPEGRTPPTLIPLGTDVAMVPQRRGSLRGSIRRWLLAERNLAEPFFQPGEAPAPHAGLFVGDGAIFQVARGNGRSLLSGIGARLCWTPLPNRRSRANRIPTLRDLHVFNRDSRERRHNWNSTRHRA